MKCAIKPGKYVLAVSGGVDSVVLLDILVGQPGVELVVAHFDHGIRQNSAEDGLLVQSLAAAHGLPFIQEEGKLSAQASEAEARHARYGFLERTRVEQGAQGIITAHHQDDVLETMFINLLRGTGRRGLTSLQSTEQIVRPLLHVSKQEITDYAKERRLQWREDSTNVNDIYLRNHLRHQIMPRLTIQQRAGLLSLHSRMLKLNALIDSETASIAREVASHDTINKLSFTMLPFAVSVEIMAHLLRAQNSTNINKKQLTRLVVAAKTARANTMHDVDKTTMMIVHKKTVQFVARSARQTD